LAEGDCVFEPLRETPLTHGDHYVHLADLQSYLNADQQPRDPYSDREALARKAIVHIASSGRFPAIARPLNTLRKSGRRSRLRSLAHNWS
jgi:glucan phosphorylase